MKFLSLLTAALLSYTAVSASPLDVRAANSTSSVGSSATVSSSSSASAASATSTAAAGAGNSTISSNIIDSNNSTLSYDSTATANSSSTYGVGGTGFANVIKTKYPLNIVLTNDDSWASANIRALYYALRRAGHRVLLVAPSHNQSGKGGTVVLPNSRNLTSAGRGGFAPVGAPYAGLNVTDPGIRYFNGTPAATAGWALDNDAALFFNASKNDTKFTGGVDLVVSGPNEGTNLGPFLYTLSGTIGATYFAVERNVPAIAFSASTKERDYPTLNFSNPNDESIKIATYSSNFVTSLSDQAKSSNASARVLPLGIGLTVNYPAIAPTGNCSNLTFVHTRLTGKAIIDRFVINGTTGLPTYADYVSDGINAPISGNVSLPGETDIVGNGKCQASASIYTVDYDAPTSATNTTIAALTSGIASLNSRNATSSSSSNRTATA